MSKLEELIQRYCPDGVEYKQLKNILKIRNGKDYKHLDNGTIPVYGSGGVMTYVDTSIYDKPSVLIPRKGSIDKLYYVDVPFWNVDTVFYTEINKSLVIEKYVFYALQKEHLEKLNTAGGVPSLTQAVLNDVEIPVPPLPVQEEIVRILDIFTELQAELQKRKSQYSYYLDNLLSFNKWGGYQTEIRRMKLKDVCMKTNNIKWKSATGQYRYIDLSSVDIQTHSIISAIEIDKMSAPSRAQQIVQGNDVIFATTRPTQMRACIIPTEYNGDICSTGYCVLRVDKKILLPRFLFFSLTVSNFKTYLSNNLTLGNYPSISNSALLEYEVPVPSLADQQKIVSILDRFDRLANDLSSGLPAEMKKRRQQYEYYRDKLLSFKRKGA
ncbi:MAG TPA: restriction endonuclease subunit S [Rikenellaceae bacterium]|nr:restriction endonuclease subunit S [Rikenellaceae bacterium]